ncbi:MAG: NAD-glutamate dehydrogenase, partial [Pseudomonadota bacterium]|nr:NAD-glutamate dehydrogenase [Pseudomonadota bacterium]
MTPEAAKAAADSAGAFSAHSDDSEAARRMAEGAALLKSSPPATAEFYRTLYRDATTEDLARYDAASLAGLASEVFARSATRKPGEPLIELFSFKAEGHDLTRNETVLLAVNDDMPFLFDSLIGEMSAQGARIRALFHPIVAVSRDAAGTRGRGTAIRESVIVLVMAPVAGKERQKALLTGARTVFSQVRLAVRDWRKMQTHLAETIDRLKQFPPPVSAEEMNESLAFLTWLGDNHFTFLGCRDYAYSEDNGGRLDPVDDSGRGVLSDVEARVLRRDRAPGTLSEEAHDFLTHPSPLIITKSNERSLVHRRVHMDYVGVKTFDAVGKLTGERRFVGLFTSGAYSRRPSEIPLLRRKVNRVRERAGLPPDSHDGKALAHILDAYPRDELFQVSEDELFTTAMGILRLGERPKVRVFPRCDRFDRFVSALVYVPRDRYDTEVRETIHAILAKAFDGRMSAATPTIDESVLARVHYIIGRNEGPRPVVDVSALEGQIRSAIRTWEDGFADALIATHGEVEGARLFSEHGNAFPARYRDAFTPEEAVRDLDELSVLAGSGNGTAIRARAYRALDDAHDALRLKLYVLSDVLPLSASLPVFENLGFRVIAEDSYPAALNAGHGWKGQAAVLDFLMERADEGAVQLAEIKDRLEEAFHAVVAGEAESDGFNRLVVSAGLEWRDVTILRTAAKYLRQTGIAFSQDYMEQALARNPDIAGLIVELFHALNDPAIEEKTRDRTATAVRERIDAALSDVPSLDDDRIIRRIRNVMDATLRTNFYQRDTAGRPKPYLAIKLDSRKIDELPAPRPHVEIFVYCPEVEGVHLRFGKVARGGIRWSDRREDFRTEILGLVKAQQVKNAVIVPVGAKGGFFPKRLPV